MLPDINYYLGKLLGPKILDGSRSLFFEVVARFIVSASFALFLKPLSATLCDAYRKYSMRLSINRVESCILLDTTYKFDVLPFGGALRPKERAT